MTCCCDTMVRIVNMIPQGYCTEQSLWQCYFCPHLSSSFLSPNDYNFFWQTQLPVPIIKMSAAEFPCYWLPLFPSSPKVWLLLYPTSTSGNPILAPQGYLCQLFSFCPKPGPVPGVSFPFILLSSKCQVQTTSQDLASSPASPAQVPWHKIIPWVLSQALVPKSCAMG